MRSNKSLYDGFQGQVREFIDHSPFFINWNKDRVTKATANSFLVTYDSLVRNFPGLVAKGTARAEDESTRAVLAKNLYEESGSGDAKRSHHAIFRRFLSTAGIDTGVQPNQPFTTEWHASFSRYISGEANLVSAIASLVATEFLALPVLARLFNVIGPLYPDADPEYFTTHLDVEVGHVREITDLIDRLTPDQNSLASAKAGYKFGLSKWNDYFNGMNNYLFAH